MAEWMSSMRTVVMNVVCGKWTDDGKGSSPVSLESCDEMFDHHPGQSNTLITLDDDSSESSFFSSDLEDGPPFNLHRDIEQDDSGSDSGRQSLGQTQVHYKGCTDMPVRIKGAQGVILAGELYLGGGYVTDSKMSTVVHKFEPVFQLWEQLPASPVKQFGMTLFGKKLVLVGGKEIGSSGSTASNKVHTWDNDEQDWKSSIPPMTFARVSPTVISYDRFLIVAGGNKGSLDYNMEIYDSESNRWIGAPPLPTKCSHSTSTVCGHTWFLLNQDNGTIRCSDIRFLVHQATGVLSDDEQSEEKELPSPTSLWQSLPEAPVKPILITTINGNLLAITREVSPVKVRSFLYNTGSKLWSYSNKLPNLCGSSSALPDSKGGLYLFGGDGGREQFSNKLYKLTLRTVKDASSTKPPITFSLHN